MDNCPDSISQFVLASGRYCVLEQCSSEIRRRKKEREIVNKKIPSFEKKGL
jgi:hypothetical protein